jgi:hypothetical protein
VSGAAIAWRLPKIAAKVATIGRYTVAVLAQGDFVRVDIATPRLNLRAMILLLIRCRCSKREITTLNPSTKGIDRLDFFPSPFFDTTPPPT